MENQRIAPGVECLSKCLKFLVSKYYDKMENQFELYVCIRDHINDSKDKRANWVCISGDGICVSELENYLLEEDNETGSGCTSFSDIEMKYLLCDVEKTILDTMLPIETMRELDIRLIFLGQKDKESFRLILKILSNELIFRIEDTLFLEQLSNIICEMNSLSLDGLSNNEFCKYFFGNLLDKEWINKEYVKQSLINRGLPDWKMFIHISSMFYEKRTVSTRLYFTKEDIRDEYILCFDSDGTEKRTLNISDFRVVRKLMELSGERYGLIVRQPDYVIEGIVDISNTVNELVCVEFVEHMVWKLKVGSEVLFKYDKWEYKLPELELEDDDQKEICKLESISDSANIVNLVKDIKSRAKYGTSIVFIRDTGILEEEIRRLSSCHRAIQVKKFNLDQNIEKIENVFSIDGAVFSNFQCECQAIGVLVDGQAKDGDSARGARYNSLLSYIYGVKDKYYNDSGKIINCLAVIISEDGMVDVVIP